MKHDYLLLGEVVRPQGIHGEVKLRHYTDDPERFLELKTVYREREGRYEPIVVTGARVREDDVSMAHEATVSKVSEDQLFYLMSRGLNEDEAMGMIVRGFVEPISRELPMEYALELNRLVELQMEGSVG